MKLTAKQSSIVTIREGDPLFRITDGMVTAPRAGLHILPECPQQYRAIIQECTSNGWLKSVAYMYDYEQTYATLKKD